DRAIGESNVHAPTVPLAAATIAAIGQVPFKLIARRIADKEERRLVERMYDELIATGTVEKNLSEDDRTVRDLHATEVLAKRPPQPEVSNLFPFKLPEHAVMRAAAPTASEAAATGGNVVALHPASSSSLRPSSPGDMSKRGMSATAST